MTQSMQKADAAIGAFLDDDLRAMIARVWEARRPPLSAFDFFPITSEADPGDQSIVWHRMDHTGQAKVIAAGATDVPLIDVHMIRNVGQIRQVADGFTISTEEVRAAKRANRPLESMKMMKAMREARKIANDIAWFGDRPNGLNGVFLEANMNRAVPTAAAAAPNGTGWNETSGKTSEEITADFQRLVTTSISVTNGVETIDTVLLPPDEYAYLQRVRASSTAPSDTTLLEFLRRTNEGVTIAQAAELADVAATRLPVPAAAAANVAFGYRRADDVLRFEIPLNFSTLAPQWRGLGYLIPAEMKVAGVIVHLPRACTTMQGI